MTKDKVLSIRTISIMHLYYKRIYYDKDENYKIVIYVMLKTMEIETTKPNKVVLYLFNSINKVIMTYNS